MMHLGRMDNVTAVRRGVCRSMAVHGATVMPRSHYPPTVSAPACSHAAQPRPNVIAHALPEPGTMPDCQPGASSRPWTPSEPREVLREMGSVGDDTVRRVATIHGPAFLDHLDPGRLWHACSVFNSCGLTSTQIAGVLLKHPSTFTYSRDRLVEVLDFLTHGPLHLDEAQLRSVITRFPQVFSYRKAQLQPQVAYLVSLGVEEGRLAEFVCDRPLLLGEGIDSVVNFLKMVRVPRKQIASLLRSYPIDYCCRFVYGEAAYATPERPFLHLKRLEDDSADQL